MIQRNSLSLFSETMPQGNGGATMNPKSRTPHRNRTREHSRYGTVFVTTSLIAVRLDGTMSTGRELRSYDHVNRPYQRVRDALRQTALTIFQSATKAAAPRAQSIAAELHVDFGGIGVKTDINTSVRNIEEKVVDTTSTPTTRLLLEWEAATMPRLFPLIRASFPCIR